VPKCDVFREGCDKKPHKLNKVFSCARASHSSQKCDRCDASHLLSAKKVTNVTSLTQMKGCIDTCSVCKFVKTTMSDDASYYHSRWTGGDSDGDKNGEGALAATAGLPLNTETRLNCSTCGRAHADGIEDMILSPWWAWPLCHCGDTYEVVGGTRSMSDWHCQTQLHFEENFEDSEEPGSLEAGAPITGANFQKEPKAHKNKHKLQPRQKITQGPGSPSLPQQNTPLPSLGGRDVFYHSESSIRILKVRLEIHRNACVYYQLHVVIDYPTCGVICNARNQSSRPKLETKARRFLLT